MDEKTQREPKKNRAKTRTISSVIAEISEAGTLDEVKTGVTAFIEFSDANPKLRKQLCRRLAEEIICLSEPYLRPLPGRKKNVVFIPPEIAPVMMILTCVPIMEGEESIYEGLNRFLAKTDEFISPVENIATEEEMNAVLDNAQEKFRLLDIVAPVKPLKIMSLNNSHIERNCECGITDSPTISEAVIFVYHPLDVSVCGRVCIFAHEIGHALHLALTGDVEVIPDGFDDLNKALDITWQTVQQKQDAFADVAAFAMLNSKGLKKYLPHRFSEPLLSCFDNYIANITNAYFDE